MALILKSGSTRFENFTYTEVNMKYAHIGSTFDFRSYYDRTNPDHRKLFKPLSYQPIQVISTKSNELLLTGTIVNHQFGISEVQEIPQLHGYTKTGILSDCPIPLEVYPIEYNGLTMRQLVERIIKPFGINLIVIDDDGITDQVIEEVSTNPGQKIESFIAELTSQRNLILNHDEKGNLIITKPSKSTAPVATFREGDGPGTKFGLSINGRGIHSDVTVFKQSDIEGENAAESTVQNKMITTTPPLVLPFRPTIKTFDFGDDVTAIQAAQNVRAGEIRENIVLTIKTDRWEWLNDKTGKIEIMRPGNIIKVLSPEIFLNNYTNFFVEEVNLLDDGKEQTATLKCVLPEVYNGQEPKDIFL